jgi:Fe-S-cluster containining protein
MALKNSAANAPKKLKFDCGQCPAYCCSIYERVAVTKRDINRLAKFFGVSSEIAERRYTKLFNGERVLKRTRDRIFQETCIFLNQETRSCTIYHGRPAVCREYPVTSRCIYYDLLKFEQGQQDDETVLPLVQIEFRKFK